MSFEHKAERKKVGFLMQRNRKSDSQAFVLQVVHSIPNAKSGLKRLQVASPAPLTHMNVGVNESGIPGAARQLYSHPLGLKLF